MKRASAPDGISTARASFTSFAAERGNAKAMHNLAVLYAEGFDGKPDYASALQWFKKARGARRARTANTISAFCSRAASGSIRTSSESFRWFALAAQSGDQDAASKRDDVAKRLDPKTLEAARAAVQNWTPEVQPDDAVTVKAPAGGWDGASPSSAAKTKSKRVQSGGTATAL